MRIDPSIEVRIPIAPTPSLLLRVHLIAHAIRSIPRYADAIITAFIGSGDKPRDLNTKVSESLGIRWRWIDRYEYGRWVNTHNPHIATITERFYEPFYADNILFLDADVLPMADPEMPIETQLGAMMAHASPFVAHKAEWRKVYTTFLQGLEPSFRHEHSGWGIMEFDEDRRYSPPYFNTGIVFASVTALKRMESPMRLALRWLNTNLNSYFNDQIALTLALEGAAVPYTLLPMRYNFPNQGEFDRRHPVELENVKFIHFLRPGGGLNRDFDFANMEALKRLTEREGLSGSNEKLRLKLAELLPSFREVMHQ